MTERIRSFRGAAAAAILVLVSVSMMPLCAGAASAPKATTLAAADVQATRATLKGTVDPGGLRTDLYFISCDPTSSPSFFTQTASKWTDGTTVKSVSHVLTGLKPNTTYRYAVTAMNSMGKMTGTCVAFTTPSATALPPAGAAPLVTTLPATEVTSATATLNASVNPGGVATKVNFRSCAESSDPAYFAPTSMNEVAAVTIPQAVGYRLSGLKPGLTYRYAVQASSSGGNTVGACVSFTTPGQAVSGRPDVTTMPASGVGSTSATLCGRVNPRGLATTYSFVSEGDAPDPDYFPATAQQHAGSASSPLNVTAHVSGLFPGQVYKYRIKAKSSAGEAFGEWVSFKTAAASGSPSVTTGPAESVLGTSAKLVGTLNANGLKTEYYFVSCDASDAPSYFMPTPRQEGSGSTAYRVSAMVVNLKPRTTYRYALKATNSRGGKTGPCVAFTTLDAQAAPPQIIKSPITNITTTSVIVECYVNPNGVATTVWVDACDAGPNDAGYFSPTPERPVGDKTEQVKISIVLTGLFPGQPYRGRFWAKNRFGSVSLPCFSFVTKGQQGIVVQTQPAQNVTASSALLVAKADPQGQNGVRVHFVHSGINSGHFDPTTAQSLYPHHGLQSVSKIVSGLNPGTKYGFCAVGTGSDGKEVRGTTVWFTTKASGSAGAPKVVTEAAQNITSTSAQLRAIISPNGLPTTFYFETYCESYLSMEPFRATQPQDCGSMANNLTRFGNADWLGPNMTYHYRVVATNSRGTAKGEYVTFKTLPSGPSAAAGTQQKQGKKTKKKNKEST